MFACSQTSSQSLNPSIAFRRGALRSILSYWSSLLYDAYRGSATLSSEVGPRGEMAPKKKVKVFDSSGRSNGANPFAITKRKAGQEAAVVPAGQQPANQPAPCDFKLEPDFTAPLDKEDVSPDDGSVGSTTQERDRGYEHAYYDLNRQDGGYQDPRRNEKIIFTLESIVEMRKLKLDRMALAIMRSVSKKLPHVTRASCLVENVLYSNDEKGPEPTPVVPKLGRDGDDVTSSLVSTESPYEVSNSSD